jgi:hypothetical protein
MIPKSANNLQESNFKESKQIELLEKEKGRRQSPNLHKIILF